MMLRVVQVLPDNDRETVMNIPILQMRLVNTDIAAKCYEKS